MIPFVEKYRPKTVDDYVGNEDAVNLLKKYCSGEFKSHLLLYGLPGVGKTTFAKIVISSFPCDTLFIDASLDRGIDTVRDKILDFITSFSLYNNKKIVLLEEADGLTINAQESLRSIMDRALHYNDTFFILTCNDHNAIIEPLKSRCTNLQILPPPKAMIAKRLVKILNDEGVSFDLNNIKNLVNDFYPDVRSIILNLERSIQNGVLLDIKTIDDNTYSVLFDLIFNEKESYEKIYHQILDLNLNYTKVFSKLFSYLMDKNRFDPQICLSIADWQYKSAFAVDKNLNFMGMVCDVRQHIKSSKYETQKKYQAPSKTST